MIADREARVRQRAHEIWESEGCPEGHAEEHWARANQEIDAEDAAVVTEEPEAEAASAPLAAPPPAAKPKPAAKAEAKPKAPARKPAAKAAEKPVSAPAKPKRTTKAKAPA